MCRIGHENGIRIQSREKTTESVKHYSYNPDLVLSVRATSGHIADGTVTIFLIVTVTAKIYGARPELTVI